MSAAVLLADHIPSSPASPNSKHSRRRSFADITQDTLTIPAAVLSEILRQLQPTLKPKYTPAIQQLVLTVVSFVAAYILLSYAPWFLLPLAWLAAGATLSLMFMIARDCANNVYTPSTVLNRIIGVIAFLPFLQSFATFKWQQAIELGKGFGSSSKNDVNDDGTYDDSPPIWVTIKERFFPPSLKQHSDTPRLTVVISAATVYAILCAILVVTWYYGGVFAILKYYVLPLVFYHIIYTPSYSALTAQAGEYLPGEVTLSIPTYQLWRLSAAVQSHFSGEAENNTDNKKNESESIYDNLSWIEFARQIYPRVHKIHLLILLFTPIIGFGLAPYTPLKFPTLVFAIFFYIISGLGITAGYHRLFAHRAYEAHPIVTFGMMMMGTCALQGSLKWWCGGHRTHHRYTDTPFDPYSAKSGFWYAHIGWMLLQPLPQNHVKADIQDLNASKMIRWQHEQYYWLGPFMAFALPTLIPGLLWGDWMGGYVYAGLIRLFVVHHATFCVNSVAHWFGDHTYDDKRTPRDHIVTALITFGEGYHNFHHEFPNDYRNGIRFYDYDPTKWLIKGLNLCGLTWKLRVFPSNEIEKGKIHMQQKKIEEAKTHIQYPGPVVELPKMSWKEFEAEGKMWLSERQSTGSSSARALVVIDEIVHDISRFISRHPGGEAFIRSAVGTNASVRIRGETGIYKHSQAAFHLLSTYRVARLDLTEAERAAMIAKEQKEISRTLPPPLIIKKSQ